LLSDLSFPSTKFEGPAKEVASMNNETLKEYLLPEIQLPYIPIVMKDHFVQVGEDVKNTKDFSVMPLQSNLERVHLKI